MKTEKLKHQENTKETNYKEYVLAKREKAKCILVLIAVSIAVSELFYKSVIPAVFMLLAIPFALKKYSQFLLEKRKEELKNQFVIGMSAYASAIRSGYSPENAVKEARCEIERTIGKKGMIAEEFKTIERKLTYHETVEGAFQNLAKRSGIEEIEDMAAVFAISKRHGGSLVTALTSAVTILKDKRKVKEEISTMMTAKKLEYRIMCLMPAGIMLYVNLTSPEFIEMLYEGVLGRIVMTIALAVYVLAIIIGERLMKVEI